MDLWWLRNSQILQVLCDLYMADVRDCPRVGLRTPADNLILYRPPEIPDHCAESSLCLKRRSHSNHAERGAAPPGDLRKPSLPKVQRACHGGISFEQLRIQEPKAKYSPR